MKRVYSETVKKYLTASGISVGAIISGIFIYLSMIGAIEVGGYSGDMVCAGTIEDPCYAYINFTAKEDIFIYPVDYDPWGRNTSFEFDPGIESWKLQRSWGIGWRNIPLDKSCTGTWCGLSSSSDVRKFSIAFREGRSYQIRIVAYKYNPNDEIKWGAFDTIDPVWLPAESDLKDYDYVYETLNRTVIDKQIETCTPTIAKNGTHYEICEITYTYKTEYYNVKLENSFEFEDKEYSNSCVNEKEGYIYVCNVPIGDRNCLIELQHEIDNGVCKKVSILK